MGCVFGCGNVKTEVVSAGSVVVLLKVLSFLMVVFYNSWVFSGVLNPVLDYYSAFVSEYASPSAVNSWFFRTCDAVTSVLALFILCVFSLNSVFWAGFSDSLSVWLKKVLWGGGFCFAVFTFVDMLFPMPCTVSSLPVSVAASDSCVGGLAFVHDVSSTIVGFAVLVMVVFSFIWAGFSKGLVLFLRFSVLLVFFGVLYCVSLGYTLLAISDPVFFGLGVAQSVSIFSLSFWCLFLVWELTGLVGFSSASVSDTPSVSTSFGVNG